MPRSKRPRTSAAATTTTTTTTTTTVTTSASASATTTIMATPASLFAAQTPIQRRSVCTLDDDTYGEQPSASGQRRRQSTLTSFFVTGSRRMAARSAATPATPAAPATPSFCYNQSVQETPPTVSPTKSSTATPPSPKILNPLKLALPKSKVLQQVYLDCGQAQFGQQLCHVCGMLYVPGVPEDAKEHVSICRDRQEGTVFTASKSHRVHWKSACGSDNNDQIISVSLRNNKAPSSPLQAAYRHVVRDLGLDPTSSIQGDTIWLYLQNQRAVGWVSTQGLTSRSSHCKVQYATNMYPGDKQTIRIAATNDSEPSQYQYQYQYQSQRPLLGIHVLWSHDQFRQQGTATRLLDCIRTSALFGMTLRAKQLAFSTPTYAGWTFGRKYCQTTGLWIYHYCPISVQTKKTLIVADSWSKETILETK